MRRYQMSREHGRHFTATVLSLLLAFGSTGISAFAEGGTDADLIADVPYIEHSWNGSSVVSAEKEQNAVPVPPDGNITGGWYYLNSDVTVSSRITVTGDVDLILGDGYTLDVRGLYVPEGNTLTVYGQSEGTGKICSHPSGGAGIGGYSEHNNGNIVIQGGSIEARGGDNCAGIGSNSGCRGGSVTIYGGSVTALGGEGGAAIGGGNNCDGGVINIYGGSVTALGGEGGAAIGGGNNCDGGVINIYGGEITANGPTDSETCENGAGIGGGDGGAGGTVTVSGGTVTAFSRDGAGIGGGDDGDGGIITISGGIITSVKVNIGRGARIGGGCDAAPGTVTITGGTVETDGGSGAGIGGGKRNTEGGTVTITGGVINASGTYGIGSGEDGADVKVSLSYTDETRDSICISASSYGGTPELEQPFMDQNSGRKYLPGTVSTTGMSGITLVAADRCCGYALSLDGDIGVDLYMALSDETAGSSAAYMEFRVPNGSKTETRQVYVNPQSDASLACAERKTYNDTECYVFRCKVSAKDMASGITAQMVNGDEKGKTYNCSVREYAEYLIAHTEVEAYAKAVPLAKALLNYGAASQSYFGVGGTLANAGLDAEDQVPGSVAVPDSFRYNAEQTRLPEGVTFAGATLSLKFETSLSLYFEGLPRNTAFTCSGKTVETDANGDYTVARIRGIRANGIENDFTVEFTGGSVTYNAMNYCFNALNGGSDDAQLQAVCKALYLYAEAANAYAG